MSEVDRSRVFGHGGLGSDVFRGLVVGIEVVVGGMVSEESHHSTNMFACLISPR